MTTSKETPVHPFRLADALDFLDDPSDFSIGLAEGENGGDEKDLAFLDDSGLSALCNDTFFACGFEHGATHLIHARSFESAWETWVDELPTIPEEELIEAYGIVDYRETFEATDPCPAWGATADEVAIEWHAVKDGVHAWHARFHAACKDELQRLADVAEASGGDYPELIEGYEMQSNCSGTGIVSMGHYAWMREVDPSDIVIARRAKEKE